MIKQKISGCSQLHNIYFVLGDFDKLSLASIFLKTAYDYFTQTEDEKKLVDCFYDSFSIEFIPGKHSGNIKTKV